MQNQENSVPETHYEKLPIFKKMRTEQAYDFDIKMNSPFAIDSFKCFSLLS